MEAKTKLIESTLPNGASIYIQAQNLGGEEDIAFTHPSFEQITKALEGIAESLTTVWEKVKPSKVSVELNVQIAWKSGILTAILADTSATASMKVTLEWQGNTSKDTSSQ